MPPDWLTALSWAALALAFGSAGWITLDVYGRGYRQQRERGNPPDKPRYAVIATGVAHCGAGCTLGDIIAEFAVFGLGASVAGLTVGAGSRPNHHLCIVTRYFWRSLVYKS
jgi:hypothetical protein